MECFLMKHENLNHSSQFRAELIITQSTKLGKIMLNAKLGTALHQKLSLQFFKPQFKKSHMTSDVVYVPINYIRNRHYDFESRQFSKSHMTSDVVYVPINYIRNHHYHFENWRFSKSHTNSDV